MSGGREHSRPAWASRSPCSPCSRSSPCSASGRGARSAAAARRCRPSAAALSVYDGRSPSEPGGSSLRVLVELPRPPLADRDDLDALSEDQQRAYVHSLEREGRVAAVGARGARRGAARRGPLRPHVGRLRGDDRRVRPRLALEPRRARAAGAPLLPRDERARAGGRARPAAPSRLRDRIAILDTGGAGEGYDALDRDDDPSAGADLRSSRRETTGDALAEIVARADR